MSHHWWRHHDDGNHNVDIKAIEWWYDDDDNGDDDGDDDDGNHNIDVDPAAEHKRQESKGRPGEDRDEGGWSERDQDLKDLSTNNWSLEGESTNCLHDVQCTLME